MLKIKNISKKFGQLSALSNVSFEVKEGSIVALLGENGAGKSTLLKIISGYFDADDGEITYRKQNIRENLSEFLQNLGYVREISTVYPDLTTYEFLRFAAELHNINANEIDNRIKEIAKLLELQNVINQKADTLSKGYKKRLELASVLIYKPQILLLDEPTEGLDPAQKNTLRNIIRSLAKNCLIIISTHTMEDVEALADYVALLHKGKLLNYTTKAAFKKIARNDLLASFIKITEN